MLLTRTYFIDVKKIREDAKIPERANPSDAGADLFYCGDNPIIIYGGESAILGTGLSMAISHGFVGEIKNRSGMASKKKLIVGACIIDSGYAGEIMINLHNIGRTAQEIRPGDKIAQILFYKVELPEFLVLPDEAQLYSGTETNSAREASGFGSTGG